MEAPPFAYPYADPTRTLNPTLPEEAPPEDRVSESWVQYGRNKLSLGLDIASPAGRRVFADLLRWAEVWLDASRPGTFARRGFPDARVLRLNPRLVVRPPCA
jgi:crotonobetainyl-CoA:carnitine CoA-transferase CaiB-like acyl-CoA transferase